MSLIPISVRHKEYKDKLASDYPKATTAHYYFLSRQIREHLSAD
jgi:hypothetical protein